MWELIGITPRGALAVVVSVLGSYATVLGLVRLLGQARRTRAGDRLVTNQAVLLMTGHQVVQENLERSHIVLTELHSRLRLARVRSRSSAPDPGAAPVETGTAPPEGHG